MRRSVTFNSRATLPRRLRRRSRNRLREIEKCDVFTLAEILRLKELRQADDLRAFFGGGTHVFDRALQVLFRLGRARHLHDADFEVTFWQISAPRRMHFIE